MSFDVNQHHNLYSIGQDKKSITVEMFLNDSYIQKSFFPTEDSVFQLICCNSNNQIGLQHNGFVSAKFISFSTSPLSVWQSFKKSTILKTIHNFI